MVPAAANAALGANGANADGISRFEFALLVAAVVFGAYLRLEPVAGALLFGDELHTLRQLDKGYPYLLSTNSSTGSGMVLPLAQRLLADLFGLNHWTIRAPAYLGGLGLLVSLYPLGRRLVGARGAALATVFVAFNSTLIFYSHLGRAYALMAWLCLVLVYVLQRIVEGDGSRRHYVYTALLVGLLPYVHLISLGLALTVAAGSLVVLFLEARHREATSLAVAVGVGLVVSVILYAPALTSLLSFVSEKASGNYEGVFGFVDVAALLVGSRSGAVMLIPMLSIALLMWAWRGGWRALPLALACIAPVLAVVAVQPFGGPYAYARYVIPMLPFGFLLLGAAFANPFLGQTRTASLRIGRTSQLVGLTLAVAMFLMGPAGKGIAEGPHANTYIGLFPLPAFDVPWPGGSPFYSKLAKEDGPLRIIEAPALASRSRHLHRMQYLQHGKETWLALFPHELKKPPEGPYVSLADREWRVRANADYLILHVQIPEEISQYWSFVFDDQQSLASASNVAAYMERQRRYTWLPKPETTPRLQQSLVAELGKPTYQDQWLWVWDLREIGSER